MYARQRSITAALVALLVTAVPFVAAPAAQAVSYDDPAGALSNQPNAHRASHDGLGALKRSVVIDSVAQAWAEKLAADYAAAKSVNPSTSPRDFLKHNPNFADQIPTGWKSAGENVAWNSGYPDPVTQMVKQWVNSSGHHDNLASTKYTHMGVGFYTDQYNVSWGVQVFAKYTEVDPDAAYSPFLDVPTTATFFDEIVWLADSGVSRGWAVKGGAVYRPGIEVSREVMAAFLYRLAGSPSFDAPARSPFLDVKTTDTFYKEIAWLADTGVSRGWAVDGGVVFRKATPVSREVMAAFLYRLDSAIPAIRKGLTS